MDGGADKSTVRQVRPAPGPRPSYDNRRSHCSRSSTARAIGGASDGLPAFQAASDCRPQPASRGNDAIEETGERVKPHPAAVHFGMGKNPEMHRRHPRTGSGCTVAYLQEGQAHALPWNMLSARDVDDVSDAAFPSLRVLRSGSLSDSTIVSSSSVSLVRLIDPVRSPE
jgi:hypothetical protein